MKWSEQTWNRAEPIYNKILELPFVCELAAGTLSRKRFDFYISQDALYIENYSRVLAHIASRLKSKCHSEDFLHFALDGLLVERALHRSFIGNNPKITTPTPTCLLYMEYETSKGLGPVEVEAAAILPCFWVYQRVGNAIIEKSVANNPYKNWIETYSDESFALSTKRAIEICDELAANCTEEIREEMAQAFILATKMEWMFWESAYNMEKWEI